MGGVEDLGWGDEKRRDDAADGAGEGRVKVDDVVTASMELDDEHRCEPEQLGLSSDPAPGKD